MGGSSAPVILSASRRAVAAWVASDPGTTLLDPSSCWSGQIHAAWAGRQSERGEGSRSFGQFLRPSRSLP
eukprot:15448290-Alexandrium_andersonii.AAC.1